MIYTKVDGFEGTLLALASEAVARPVTVSKDSISGLLPNADGKYIIPQGTFLKGVVTSLLNNPNQLAVQRPVVATAGTVVFGTTKLDVTNVIAGNFGIKLTTVKAGEDLATSVVEVNTAQTEITVTLATATGAITETWQGLADAINADAVASQLVEVAVHTGTTPTALATAGTATTTGGVNDSNTDVVDGVLVHSLDVTGGKTTGSMFINGFMNIDKLPVAPSSAVKATTPIKFIKVNA